MLGQEGIYIADGIDALSHYRRNLGDDHSAIGMSNENEMFIARLLNLFDNIIVVISQGNTTMKLWLPYTYA